jgi:hypothetical protein
MGLVFVASACRKRWLTFDCSCQAAWRRPAASAARPTHSIAASGWLQITPSDARQSRQPPRRSAAASMKPLAAKSKDVSPTDEEAKITLASR